MGAFCCCPCEEEFEEYTHPSSFTYRHCICLRHFFHRLLSGYSAQRIDGRDVTLSTQGGTPLASTSGYMSDDVSLSESYRLVPRPASYDTDPRYSRSQRDGLVSRHEKSLSHIQEGSQAIKRSSSSSGTVHLGAAKKQDITDIEEESKAAHSESEKIVSGKASYGIDYTLTTSEDEDVCPTCLEEYTSDNPKILTQCAHHFHLSCIYEWMERSENCPICGKEMEFCESP